MWVIVNGVIGLGNGSVGGFDFHSLPIFPLHREQQPSQKIRTSQLQGYLLQIWKIAFS